MSEEMPIRHCSPTLAGLKTGSLFSMAFSSEGAMRGTLAHWNRTLGARACGPCQCDTGAAGG